jgi:mono/diheme cytochrome c family protein
MRPPVPGAVARGHLNENTGFHTGMRDSLYVDIPLKIDMPLLERGKERFDIFCAVCHGRTGNGKSIMALKGFTPAPSYQDPRLLEMKDGQLFQVITQGIRNMPGLSNQLPVSDRWAVVAYVRALQRSVNATLADVPPQKQNELK